MAGIVTACAAPPPPTPPAPVPAPAPPELEPPPLAPCVRIERLTLHKRERTLRAQCAGGRELELRVALGRAPDGTKERTGDYRTPEGSYRLHAVARSRFHLFIPLDYPSPDDARRGFQEGRITLEDRRRIERAHAEGAMPPADTPLGGAIGLHGEGEEWSGASRLFDWTFGCVALSDRDIELLASRTAPGTPIDIQP
jgi:murein L,D-transpeptidase YafK